MSVFVCVLAQLGAAGFETMLRRQMRLMAMSKLDLNTLDRCL